MAHLFVNVHIKFETEDNGCSFSSCNAPLNMQLFYDSPKIENEAFYVR